MVLKKHENGGEIKSNKTINALNDKTELSIKNIGYYDRHDDCNDLVALEPLAHWRSQLLKEKKPLMSRKRRHAKLRALLFCFLSVILNFPFSIIRVARAFLYVPLQWVFFNACSARWYVL